MKPLCPCTFDLVSLVMHSLTAPDGRAHPSFNHHQDRQRQTVDQAQPGTTARRNRLKLLHLLHFLPSCNRTRFHQIVYTMVLPPTYTQPSRMPMRKADTNRGACAPTFPMIHALVRKASHCQWPSSWGLLSLHPTETNQTVTLFSGGNRHLRQAAQQMGTGMRGKGRHKEGTGC